MLKVYKYYIQNSCNLQFTSVSGHLQGMFPYVSICFPYVFICFYMFSICFPYVSICFPYVFHMFLYVFHMFPYVSICFPYVSICFYMFSICFPYVFHINLLFTSSFPPQFLQLLVPIISSTRPQLGAGLGVKLKAVWYLCGECKPSPCSSPI